MQRKACHILLIFPEDSNTICDAQPIPFSVYITLAQTGITCVHQLTKIAVNDANIVQRQNIDEQSDCQAAKWFFSVQFGIPFWEKHSSTNHKIILMTQVKHSLWFLTKIIIIIIIRRLLQKWLCFLIFSDQSTQEVKMNAI